MKIKKGMVLRDVCGVQVIVGEGLEAIDFGKMLSLNETGAFLWRKATEQGDFSVDSLADALYREYDVEQEQAKADVSRVVDEWLAAGVIE